MVRERVLTKGKLRAVWSGAGAMGYPYEGVFKLLILTGQRKDQVARTAVVRNRFRRGLMAANTRTHKVQAAHRVPLAPLAFDLLRKQPVGPRATSLLAPARR